MRVVVAIPTGGLLVGCALGLFRPDASFSFLLSLLIAAAVVAGYALHIHAPSLLATAVAVGFVSGGMLLAAHAWRMAWRPTLRVAFESMARDERSREARAGRPPPEDDSASVVLVGVLRTDAAPTASGGVSLNLATRWIGRARSADDRRDPAVNPVDGGVLLTIIGTMAGERLHEWRAGRTIRAFAQLHRPARYLDPGVPDQERALARKGVALVGSIKSAALVEVLSRGSPFAEMAASVRSFTRRAIASAVGRWSVRSAAIVTAIVIGDRAGLDDEVERRLQEAGTYHVIAISGGNIAILAGLTLVLFRMAGLLGRAAMLSAMAGLLSYGYLVGGGASVDRATLMAAVYFVGRALDLRGPVLNALVLVAGLLIVSDPLAIADPAFLLTFGATTAILAVSQEVPLRRLHRIVVPLAAMFIASASAEAALLPVGATIFSRVTFAGLALNFAAIPLMAVAQIAGMLAVPVFLVFGPLASAVGWVAHAGAQGLMWTADLVRFAPIVTWRVAPPAVGAIAAYYIGSVGAFSLWRRISRRGETPLGRAVRRLATVTAVLASLWILAEPWTFIRAGGDGRLHVTFIDVGQGDSALVRFPRGSTLLVDAGGLPGGASFDVGDRVVAPVLRDAGVRRLGTLALTHGDSDHVAGAVAAVLEFRPRDIWEGIPVPPSGALNAIRDAGRRASSRWTNVQVADTTSIDDVEVVVRHPGLPDWERQDVRNDDSVVIELLWREVSIVLTGDIGAEVEREIAPRFPRVPMRVVKMPHHGSLTSSSQAFVRALDPQVAVVSVGRANRFGHPAPAVLRRYEEAGAAIFRTDQDGAVTVDTDGTSVDIHTFTGRHLEIRANDSPRRHEAHEEHAPNASTDQPAR